MKNKITLSSLILFCFVPLLSAQEMARDTTSASYKLGYQIGVYLPIAIIMVLAFFFIRKAFRFKE